MNNKNFIAKKSVGEFISVISVALIVITMLYYYNYTSSLGAVNGMIIVCLLISAACNLMYFLIDIDSVVDIGIVEILASLFTTFSIVMFFQDSWSNLADLLNGIQIFSGGTGNITSIITILVFLVVIEVAEIVTCFMKKIKVLS